MLEGDEDYAEDLEEGEDEDLEDGFLEGAEVFEDTLTGQVIDTAGSAW